MVRCLNSSSTAPSTREGSALRKDTARLREFVAGQIRAARVSGEAPTGIDPASAVTALLALVEELGIHVLGEYSTPDTAVTVLDAHLSTLFGLPRSAP